MSPQEIIHCLYSLVLQYFLHRLVRKSRDPLSHPPTEVGVANDVYLPRREARGARREARGARREARGDDVNIHCR